MKTKQSTFSGNAKENESNHEKNIWTKRKKSRAKKTVNREWLLERAPTRNTYGQRQQKKSKKNKHVTETIRSKAAKQRVRRNKEKEKDKTKSLLHTYGVFVCGYTDHFH